MKNKVVTILLIACAIFAQRLLFQITDLELYKIPFASSLMVLENQTGNLILTLYAFLPIPFILFYFSGRAGELAVGYGKLCIIRSYKRERLCLKIIGIFGIELLIIIFFQTVLFSFFDEKWHGIKTLQFFLIIVAYYLGLWAIVILQLYLDFCMDSNYSNLFINLFFLTSLFIGNYVLPSKNWSWVGVCLFPNMLFGVRNGIISQATINIKFQQVIVSMAVILIILCILTILKFRKKDIF